MKKLLFLLFCLCMLGCSSAPKVEAPKAYPVANAETKQKLLQDLRAGRIALGASIEQIRMTYGDSDTMKVSAGGKKRLVYTNGKNITLFSEDGETLASWQDY